LDQLVVTEALAFCCQGIPVEGQPAGDDAALVPVSRLRCAVSCVHDPPLCYITSARPGPGRL